MLHYAVLVTERGILTCNGEGYFKIVLLPPPKNEIVFSGLSVCLLDYSKSAERILMKFSGGVGRASGTKLIGFWWSSGDLLPYFAPSSPPQFIFNETAIVYQYLPYNAKGIIEMTAEVCAAPALYYVLIEVIALT